MNAQELFDLAPLGARITYSNGTPRPPERFKNKLREWEGRNNWGYFSHANPGGEREHDTARFTLTQHRSGVIGISVNRIFGIDSKLDFAVEMPKAGTILAYRKPLAGIEDRGTVEVRYVWPDLAAARAWATTPPNRYDLNDCGLCYYMVGDDGSLVPYTPPEA